MAFPENLDKVHTNFPKEKLIEVVKAVEEERVSWDLPKTFVYMQYCEGEFEYDGKRYSISENCEEVDMILLI